MLIAALAVFVSCQKQQTDEEKNAEVERKVQERLASERQTQEIAQRQADLDAREKALADKQNAAALPAENSEREEQQTTGESRTRSREPRERSINVVYSTFYNKLEPYGDWIGTNDYGYVFHPRQAESSRTWRPYTNGRWVYTDAGWTWISEEPFGWATYHYGRWTRLHGIGWVWVPGNQWAPAWVSWRKSSDYVGWAPLPPEARFDQHTGIHNWSDSYYDVGPDQYCFVASREFGAPRVEQTLLPPERNVTIINQTTNVTNITYNNTTIVNEGPNYEELRSTRRAPVRNRCHRGASDCATGRERTATNRETNDRDRSDRSWLGRYREPGRREEDAAENEIGSDTAAERAFETIRENGIEEWRNNAERRHAHSNIAIRECHCRSKFDCDRNGDRNTDDDAAPRRHGCTVCIRISSYVIESVATSRAIARAQPDGVAESGVDCDPPSDGFEFPRSG
ncbi:MAG: hypothetical protein DME57_01795 [Verrucomicrobia bacterium]|nr:MAG: hypothetical protein DME57_01795 [Verrucomicrobiota bacterium]